MAEEPRRRGALILRMVGEVLTSAGLATLYGWAVVAAVAGWQPPSAVWWTGAVMASGGCLWLIVLLASSSARRREWAAEATLGFFSLPAGMFGFVASLGDEWKRYRPLLLVMTVLLLAAIALIVLAARAKRESQRWRNTAAND